jgi:ferredoxin
VNPALCIGCGICQYKCPVNDKYAVYITSIKNGGLLINNNSGEIDGYF